MYRNAKPALMHTHLEKLDTLHPILALEHACFTLLDEYIERLS